MVAAVDHLPSLFTIASVVSLSVLKLVLCGVAAAVGFRSLRKDGTLGPSICKELSGLNKQLFVPMLIFSKCAQGITSETIVNVAFVPLMSLAFMLIGLVIGAGVTRLTCSPRFTPIGAATCAFSNVVGLPLPLVLSLVSSLPGIRDDPSAQDRCVSYLFLFNVVSSVCMWTCGPKMMAPAKGATPMLDRSERSDSTSMSSAADELQLQPMSECVEGSLQRDDNSGGVALDVDGGDGGNGDGSRAMNLEALGSAGGRGGGSDSGSGKRDAGSCWERLQGAGRTCSSLLSRPALASLLGVATGVAPPLRALFVPHAAPLRCALDAMDLLSSASIPLILFVLGATLSQGPASGGAPSAMPLRTFAALIGAKLVAVPMCNLAFFTAAVHGGILPRDNVLSITLLVVASSPSAMNLSTISSLAGQGEREVALLLFWQYILAVFSISFFAVAGLLLLLD